jgi:hypothetical protein
MTDALDTLTVVRSQSAALIRAEVRSAGQRARLERACSEAITRLGCGIDDVSEASGLTTDEIRRVIDQKEPSLDELAGVV